MNKTIAKSVGNSNPLIDHHLGADPFALTYNGRVYIYMSSDNYDITQMDQSKKTVLTI